MSSLPSPAGDPPDEEPPGCRKPGCAWAAWAACSIGLPAGGILIQDGKVLILLSQFGALLGILASFVVGSTLADASKQPGRFWGLSLLFAMGSCGIILALLGLGFYVFGGF